MKGANTTKPILLECSYIHLGDFTIIFLGIRLCFGLLQWVLELVFLLNNLVLVEYLLLKVLFIFVT